MPLLRSTSSSLAAVDSASPAGSAAVPEPAPAATGEPRPTPPRSGWLRLLRLPWREKLRVILTLPLVLSLRLALWVLPFHVVKAAVSRGSRLPPSAEPPSLDHARRIARGVRRASRFVPRATCLTQALAAHLLLRRAGHRSTIHIGVAHREDRGFEAHAWVSCDGEILIGGKGSRRFTPLTSWE